MEGYDQAFLLFQGYKERPELLVITPWFRGCFIKLDTVVKLDHLGLIIFSDYIHIPWEFPPQM